MYAKYQLLVVLIYNGVLCMQKVLIKRLDRASSTNNLRLLGNNMLRIKYDKMLHILDQNRFMILMLNITLIILGVLFHFYKIIIITYD